MRSPPPADHSSHRPADRPRHRRAPPGAGKAITSLTAAWRACPGLTGPGLALALRTGLAARQDGHARRARPVWTGPGTVGEHASPPRCSTNCSSPPASESCSSATPPTPFPKSPPTSKSPCSAAAKSMSCSRQRGQRRRLRRPGTAVRAGGGHQSLALARRSARRRRRAAREAARDRRPPCVCSISEPDRSALAHNLEVGIVTNDADLAGSSRSTSVD